MSKTTVGLFADSGVADQVVLDLKAGAFPTNEIRILKEPLDMAVNGQMSIPRTDFQVAVERELMTIGVTVPEASAYARGLQRGGVLVLVTGSTDQSADATAIMNRRGAIEVEELTGREPNAATMIAPERPIVDGTSAQTCRTRQSGGGARMFIW